MKLIRVTFAVSVLAMLSGCVLVPVGPGYYSGSHGYYGPSGSYGGRGGYGYRWSCMEKQTTDQIGARIPVSAQVSFCHTPHPGKV